MKIDLKISKQELTKKNIEHSSKKWVSKVSIRDTKKYLSIIKSYLNLKKKDKLNILSLGVRNGREVDMFRVCQSNFILIQIIQFLEIKKIGFRTLFTSFFESINRADISKIDNKSVVGVDINPKSKRRDVAVQSFENLSEEFKNKFDVVYTNSLDHTMDPNQVAQEIKKCLKNIGFVIVAFPLGQDSGIIDPSSGIGLTDIKNLFGEDIIYYKYAGSSWGYTEFIIKVDSTLKKD